MARVYVRTGTEGPRHDPYIFTEVTFVKTDGTEVRYHYGLAQWLEVNGKPIDVPYEEMDDKFEELTGMSAGAAERVPDKLQDRYVRTLSKEEQHVYWMCREADDRYAL